MDAFTRRTALRWSGTGLGLALLGSADLAAAPTGPIVLTVSGDLVGQPPHGIAFDVPMMKSLGERSIKAQTPWFTDVQTFTGPLLADVLAAAGARGKRLKMIALNDYGVEIPLDDVDKFKPVLARKINGKILGIRDKGPLFLMYPFADFSEIRNDVYYARCIWQLHRILVM